MKQKLIRWIQEAWYHELYLSSWLMPFSMLYVDAIRFRRFLYRLGVLKKTRLPVPVIVVGNITVGGTGKTPLVIWLVAWLKQQGHRPGVISRGYAGAATDAVQRVTVSSDPTQVGDEALLLAKHCQCPVAVGVDRVAAGRLLLAESNCTVIVSDDGLQHYALQRDIEIAVIDGQRRFGNGYCLPVGPLREPPERIRSVDLVVVNTPIELQEGEFAMHYRGQQLLNLATGESQPLAALQGMACHAVAGVGNPTRFFEQLAAAGLNCQRHAFPDHHPFTAQDLQFNDTLPLVMTEKDAVKCGAFAQPHHWYLPVTADVPVAFSDALHTLLTEKTHG
jgi:tetraacyldisaccharide 4'-kinase